VTPHDYTPSCAPVPVDPRLPLGGQQLCGLYDINPTAFGQVDNLITRNNNYGKQEESYNGVDVNFQARVLGKGTLGGGWNVGNAVQLGIVAGGSASSGTNTCYVIDSPQQLFNCKVDVPYQNRVKLNGSYTLPYAIQVAAVFQSNPGANYGANRTYTLAEIQPALGRPRGSRHPARDCALGLRAAHQSVRPARHQDPAPGQAARAGQRGRLQLV